MNAQQIKRTMLEIFRLGRDLEAHAAERITDPENWDRLCDCVAEELARLQEMVAGSRDAKSCVSR